MPTPTKGPRLGGSPAHQRLILSNMAGELFTHGRLKTTLTRAKRLRPFAEKLITTAKAGDLNARRRVQSAIAPRSATNKNAVYELLTNIAPAMAERNGGYTRITKIGNRSGDNAPMAVIELVMEPVSPKQAVVKEAQKATEQAAPEVETQEDAPANVAEMDEAATPAEATETEAAEAPAEEAHETEAKEDK